MTVEMTFEQVKKAFFDQPLHGIWQEAELKSMWFLWFSARFEMDRLGWLRYKTQPFPLDQLSVLEADVVQLKSGKPMQYVLNEAFFWGRSFILNECVLIPRPETEELIEWALQLSLPNDARIIDLGSGSGIIPITLKLERPTWQATGVEISECAIQTCQQNAKRLEAEVSWLEGNMLEMLLPPWDLLISNPPYIPDSERHTLEQHVLAFEPEMALFAPAHDDLLFYRHIAVLALQAPVGKNILLELNPDKADEIAALFEPKKTTLRLDMQGRKRMLHVLT